MSRLDQQRQNELEPKRMQYAKEQIEALGYEVNIVCKSRLEFEFDNSKIFFFPYSGWASGSKIKDGRGLKNLLKQI